MKTTQAWLKQSSSEDDDDDVNNSTFSLLPLDSQYQQKPKAEPSYDSHRSSHYHVSPSAVHTAGLLSRVAHRPIRPDLHLHRQRAGQEKDPGPHRVI